jgi:hypothetical protein
MALKRKFGAPPTHDPDGNEIEYPVDAPAGVDAYWRVRELRIGYEKDYDDASAMVCSFEVEALIDETKVKYNSIFNASIEENAEGTWEEGHITSQEYLEDQGAKSYSMSIEPDLTCGNLVGKAYEYLKTLDLFKDAEDC